MNHYKYKGPVLCFGNTVASQWEGETYAQTESKARSNLAYQYRQETRLTVNSRITVPGKLTII